MSTFIPSDAVRRQIDQTFCPAEVKATVNLDQVQRMDALTTQARSFAIAISELSASSREQSLALTKLDEALMMANAAIARHG